jgi:hypothetical protein
VVLYSPLGERQDNHQNPSPIHWTGRRMETTISPSRWVQIPSPLSSCFSNSLHSLLCSCCFSFTKNYRSSWFIACYLFLFFLFSSS